MNDFNKGIDYAFEYIRKHIRARVVNGDLKGVITEEQLSQLQEKIHRKCNSCTKPCKTDWCCTKD